MLQHNRQKLYTSKKVNNEGSAFRKTIDNSFKFLKMAFFQHKNEGELEEISRSYDYYEP